MKAICVENEQTEKSMCLKLKCEPSISSFNYAISINELQTSESKGAICIFVWRDAMRNQLLIDRLKLGKYVKPSPSQALISLAESTFNVNCDSVQPTWEWRMIYWKLNWWLYRGLLNSKIDKRFNRHIGQSIKSWRTVTHGNYIQMWKKHEESKSFLSLILYETTLKL